MSWKRCAVYEMREGNAGRGKEGSYYDIDDSIGKRKRACCEMKEKKRFRQKASCKPRPMFVTSTEFTPGFKEKKIVSLRGKEGGICRGSSLGRKTHYGKERRRFSLREPLRAQRRKKKEFVQGGGKRHLCRGGERGDAVEHKFDSERSRKKKKKSPQGREDSSGAWERNPSFFNGKSISLGGSRKGGALDSRLDGERVDSSCRKSFKERNE